MYKTMYNQSISHPGQTVRRAYNFGGCKYKKLHWAITQPQQLNNPPNNLVDQLSKERST